jgi:hypothetical protein
MTHTHKTIYLLLHENGPGEHVWCDEPNPAALPDDEKPDTVEYIQADEHRRLLKAGVNEARIVALQHARDAVLALKRKCKDTPEGQSALMIYEYAETAIHSLIRPPSDTSPPALEN